ncbi:MAG: hypothetical protein V4707_12860 [Pseudomonadota bacterium]
MSIPVTILHDGPDWGVVAAWVQAVGSVLAILAAVLIANAEAFRARKVLEVAGRRNAEIWDTAFIMSASIIRQARDAASAAGTVKGFDAKFDLTFDEDDVHGHIMHAQMLLEMCQRLEPPSAAHMLQLTELQAALAAPLEANAALRSLGVNSRSASYSTHLDHVSRFQFALGRAVERMESLNVGWFSPT